MEKYRYLLDYKLIRFGLILLSALAIFTFGKCVGEFIYYLSH